MAYRELSWKGACYPTLAQAWGSQGAREMGCAYERTTEFSGNTESEHGRVSI